MMIELLNRDGPGIELLEIPPEFEHINNILIFGAEKHGANTWLNPGVFQYKARHDSMFHHLAASQQGIRLDDESGQDHLLHLGLNALMGYTLTKRGIWK